METPETPNFGLTRIGQGESLSKNGFQALDTDRVTLDALLHALEFHSHDAAPRLPDPGELEPALTAAAIGGQLPAATTFYYCVSLLDRWGLETAVCTEADVTTPVAVSIDGAPAVTASDTGGTLTAGQYSYVYTYVSATGGETEPSPSTSARVPSGTTNSCAVDIPDLPAEASHANIYRSRDGQSQFFYCGEHDGLVDVFIDDGSTMNYTIVAPRLNTTGGTCAITVDLSAWPEEMWEGASGWRLYRSLSPGGYTGISLVHEVVEPEAEGSAVLRKTWLDDGDELQPGMPKGVSSTLSGGAVVDMAAVEGQLPVTAMPRGGSSLSWGGPVSGTIFDGTSQFPKIYLPYDVAPIAFQLSTTGVTGRDSAPLDITLLSTGGATVGDPVKLVLDDNSGLYTATWPLANTVRFQGESMTRSDIAAVLSISDLNASSGRAVELDAMGEYVEEVYDLEPGIWKLRIRQRYTTTWSSDDLHYQFYDGVTSLADVSYNHANNSSYGLVEPAITGGGLNWAGGELTVRILKATTSTQVHYIDWVEMYTQTPTLPGGQAYVSYPTPSGGTVGTHHFYTLWY